MPQLNECLFYFISMASVSSRSMIWHSRSCGHHGVFFRAAPPKVAESGLEKVDLHGRCSKCEPTYHALPYPFYLPIQILM
jgi:hypothetical protein